MESNIKSNTDAWREAMAEQLVKHHLHFDHAFAKTRSELCTELNVNDRELRRIIEVARGKGALICNDCDGFGYYLGAERSDIVKQYRREKARMVKHWNAMRPFYEQMKEWGLDT